MTINANIQLLKDNLNNTIVKLDKRKDEDKMKTTFAVTYGGLISGLTTILIGLSSYLNDYSIYFNIAALVTSASLTVVQSWDNLFNHKKLWIMQAEALGMFKELHEDISHLEANGEIDQATTDLLYERYKHIHRTRNSNWKDLRLKE